MVGKKNKTLNMLIRIVYKLRTVKDNFYHYDTILDIVQPYDYPLPNKDDYISLVIYPVKGDKIFIDGIGYLVLQRDLYLSREIGKQTMTLFVRKP